MGRSHRSLSWLRRHVFALYCAVVAALVLLAYLRPEPALSLSGGVGNQPPVLGELKEVVSYVYEPDGRRRYESETDVMKRLRDDEVVVLEPVTMRYYSATGQATHLQSQFGEVRDKGESIRLRGAVELEQFTGDAVLQRTVQTRDVEIKTDQAIAVTQAAVTIRHAGQVTRGRGMIADLQRGEIELLEAVRVSGE